MNLFNDLSHQTSKLITNAYSTSFSKGIKSLHKDFHDPIYSIYGFVRLADEIVDSFHNHEQEELIEKFESDAFLAIEQKISLNPVLNSFQLVVNKYNIDHTLIKHFLISMKMDLTKKEYKKEDYDTYIYGSAEAVGLMCLKVFCEGDEKEYHSLEPFAKNLGSSFQKINFLRDLKSDYYELNRMYFPDLDVNSFNDDVKTEIETEIEKEFAEALKGIKRLPKKAKFGVYLAFTYYFELLKKIKRTPADKMLSKRIRINNVKKYYCFINSFIKHRLGLI